MTTKMRWLRAGVDLRREDAGFGLMELIVAVFIFGILATMLVTLLTTVSRSFTRERAATDSTMVASIGMNELTRVVRSGTQVPVAGGGHVPVFVEAYDNKLTLHAYIDTDSLTLRPIKVQFRVDSATNDLIETRWASYPVAGQEGAFAFRTTPESSRTIARKIVAPADGTPLFSYLSVVTEETDPNFGTLQPLNASSGVAAAALPRISVVQITMNVQADVTERADPVMLVNRVGIPNLGISRIGL